MNNLGVRFMAFESNGSPRMVPRLWWEFESMNSLGLVAPEPNPFVFTGKPKAGQVWESKHNPGRYVVVTKTSSYGAGSIQYSSLAKDHFNHMEGMLSKQAFQKFFRFSH